MKSTRLFVSLCLCGSFFSSAVPARAIELSLEENRAERGSVGYVDMKRLFTASPDAARAREGLEELVRQAEERVNSKKADLLRLRQELGTLKIEREDLARSTPTVSVPLPAPAKPKPAPAPAPMAAPVPAKPMSPTPAPKPVEAPVAPVTALPPADGPAASTQAAPAPLTINLPGLTDGPLNLERPGASPLNPTRDRGTPMPPPAPEPSPVVPVAPVAVATAAAPAPEPEPAPAPAVPAGPTMAQRLLEMDGRIVALQGDIDRLQGELDRERLGAERTLLDAEGRKTDQVLARLYRAISEVARREGVSVVVDKSATLYGHPAVDLTDKVLKQLRGVVPAQ
ncbi:MAG: OmpH family outer membrane protein [Elusimicrobia bacterium]|nr:OmpH family outer membrane protein [Elusimicrobiota bacterium]